MKKSSIKVAFYTLGCKLNYSESSSIANILVDDGYEHVSFKEIADVYIINTCTVTQVADSKCRTAIRQAKKRNPDAIIAVIGCYAQVNPEEIEKIEGVDIILGNKEKYKLKEYLNKISNNRNNKLIAREDFKNDDIFIPTYSMNDRTRCFYKIQDGCNYFCTYCKVPYARGRSRSGTIKDTLDVAKEIKSISNIKELVLTGINIGDYGKKHNETLFDLLTILDKEEIFPRIRLSSIEPELISDEIIDLFAQSKILMPHFHIPLQSGSDDVLSRMKRHYNTDFFEKQINKIKNKIKNVCIAIDIIVGFPGESDTLFEETYNFVKKLNIAYLHVFTYSDRSGTLASLMNDKIKPSDKDFRSKKMHELAAYKNLQFFNQNKNHTTEVLFESTNNHGYISGFSNNYIKVNTTFDSNLINTIKQVKLIDVSNDGTSMNINIIN